MAFEPKQFGRFFLLEKLAVGGMAEIYKAKTYGAEGFEKQLAIKRILPHCSADKEFIRMLIDEAKLSVLLSHANIVQVYDLGKVGEDFFISMEFINGVNLRDVLYRCREQNVDIPPEIAIYILSEICKGLDYAHRKTDGDGKPLGIVHRDVSPQNILISFEGEVKIVDFGIAKAAMNISHTMAGILKGKIAYMSPEQALGKPVDYRTDLFSAGIILYECLTGTKLFKGESQFEVLKKIRSTKITESTLPEEIPLTLRPIVAKALAYLARERYQNAGDLQSDLTRYLYSSYVDFTPRRLADFVSKLFSTELERQQQQAIARHQREHPTASVNVNEEMLQENLVNREGLEHTDTDITPSPNMTGSIPLPPERSLSAATLAPRRSVSRLVIVLLVCLSLVGAGYAYYRWGHDRLFPSTVDQPSTPAVGALHITSVPEGAQIFLNGQDMKQATPALLEELRVGSQYQVQLRKEGFTQSQRNVTISDTETTTLEVTLTAQPDNTTGTVTPTDTTPTTLNDVPITSTPAGATVFVNGSALESPTPTTLPEAIIGEKYTISLFLEGYAERSLEWTASADATPISVPPLSKHVDHDKTPRAIQGPSTTLDPNTIVQDPTTTGTDQQVIADTAVANTTPTAEDTTPPATTGSITVRTEPKGARILVNGKDSGLTTPATVDNLPLGKKTTIQVKKDGYVGWARSVTLAADHASMTLSQKITKAAGTAKPRPSNTTTSNTKTPERDQTEHVQPPIEKETTTTSVARSGDAELQKTTEQVVSLGAIAVSSKPKGATVYLDGNKFGRAPLIIDRVRVGQHTIRITKSGYADWEQSITVSQDEETSVHAPLEKD